MREITWLQVSDFHMRQRDAWSQDVVLRAMAESVRRRRNQGMAFDFILATGDLAFSGKKEEYELVKRFFDELVSASGVSKDRIFCIPGNHDVNRDRQKMCFLGARHTLASPNMVDPFLAPDNDDLATLSLRQEGYREFQASYFSGQLRTATPDGLAYVSSITVDDVIIAIVGLNSAWLAEGGKSDHGNLLIGERQVISAFDAADKLNAHIVIGMAHHPLHLLRDFDRNAATRRIIELCDFYHCGHLHQPESHGAGFDPSACLTVAAGASFETREFQNAYSQVRLSLLSGTRTLATVQYSPGTGAFELSSEEQFPIRLDPSYLCPVDELADAIAVFDTRLTPHCYYLAALLMNQKTEVPIPGKVGHAFGAISVLQGTPEEDYYRKVVAFLRFGNVLTVFCGRYPLADLLHRHGQAISVYGSELNTRCQSDVMLENRLAQQDMDVRSLFATQPKISFAVDLFADLAQSQEWALLAEHARRHLKNQDPATQVQARRMLALALTRSTEVSEWREAVSEYQSLIHDGAAEVQDRSNLAAMLLNLGRPAEAMEVVLQAVDATSNEALDPLKDIGHRIVGHTGDREFREQLEAAIGRRRGRE